MSLKDLLQITEKNEAKKGLSEERVRGVINNARDLIAYWREYPDLFVDFMKGPNSTFNLYFYQIIH